MKKKNFQQRNNFILIRTGFFTLSQNAKFGLQTSADDKVMIVSKKYMLSDRVENNEGKGENAGCHNVFRQLFFPNGCENLGMFD